MSKSIPTAVRFSLVLLFMSSVILTGSSPGTSREIEGQKVIIIMPEPLTVHTPEPERIVAIPTPTPYAEEETKEETEQVSRPQWEYNERLDADENIYIFLTEYLHWSKIAACAAIANMCVETGATFSPTIGTVSYGLVQWLGSRWDRCCSWCWDNGYSEWSIEGQCRYMNHELRNNYPSVWNAMCEADNAYDAAYLFCVYYEAPLDTYGQAYYRASLATEYYRELTEGE